MANVSDVNVTIEAKGCANEVRTWLKAIDKDAYYTICNDHTGEEQSDLGENSAVFDGVADGRWTYERNLEGAFGAEEERKIWCGNSEEVQIAYNALLLALKDNHDAYFILDYTECELGVGFVGKGKVFIKYDEDAKGVEMHVIRQDEGEVNIDNLIAYGFASDEQDAKEYMGVEE